MKRFVRLTFALTLAAMLSACVGSSEPTQFVLINDGNEELFRDAQPSWLSLQADGEPALLNRPTCMKQCGKLEFSRICALGAVYPTVVRLEPGEESTIEWDGVYFQINQAKDCYHERRRPAEFEAEFCYGRDFEPAGGETTDDMGDTIGGAQVADPVCETRPFERGEVVELLAE